MTKRKVEQVTGALAERQTSKGRRVKLTKAEREAFQRQQRAELAAVYFLDLEEGHTWKSIAEAMDISVHQLKEVTKTEEFDEAYNQLFADLGHDPRYRAAQGALADMLPLALGKLKSLISSDQTAGGTKLRAIEKVIALNGLENVQPVQSDRQELVQFLVNNKIDLTSVQIVLPQEYHEAETEIIEGEYKDTTPQLLDNPDTQSISDEHEHQSDIDQVLEDELLFPEDMIPSSSTTANSESVSMTREEQSHHLDIEGQSADR
jgi:hypothetical protein